jgi:transcriptional regulator with XRE-family HTH domain
MATFGAYIKETRKKLKLSQTQFGAKVDINAPAISRIENNRKEFPSGKLDLLAQVFNEDISTINELFYADKFARMALDNDCPSSVFMAAEDQAKYYRSKNSSQGTLNL